MLARSDIAYCILAFGSVGINTLMSCTARQDDRYYELNDAVTAALVVILTGLWSVFALLMYKVRCRMCAAALYT